MKKYSVYNLKVVKVETSTNTRYLICRYNNLTKEYIEVLTGEKIEVKNNENVEPLSNYYSVLGLHCYGIPGSILGLTKKDILSKYLEINSEELEKTEERKKEKNRIVLKRAPEGYEITDEEMEIMNRLNRPKKDEFEKLYLSSEDYDRIYQNVVGDVLEVANKPKENKELTELAEGLKKTRKELVELCESNPEQAKELAIEALIRTGVIKSSDDVVKGKAYTKERKIHMERHEL